MDPSCWCIWLELGAMWFPSVRQRRWIEMITVGQVWRCWQKAVSLPLLCFDWTKTCLSQQSVRGGREETRPKVILDDFANQPLLTTCILVIAGLGFDQSRSTWHSAPRWVNGCSFPRNISQPSAGKVKINSWYVSFLLMTIVWFLGPTLMI